MDDCGFTAQTARSSPASQNNLHWIKYLSPLTTDIDIVITDFTFKPGRSGRLLLTTPHKIAIALQWSYIRINQIWWCQSFIANKKIKHHVKFLESIVDVNTPYISLLLLSWRGRHDITKTGLYIYTIVNWLQRGNIVTFQFLLFSSQQHICSQNLSEEFKGHGMSVLNTQQSERTVPSMINLHWHFNNCPWSK